MTELETMIKAIETAKGLRRFKYDAGETYLCETFVTDTDTFGWVVKHPSKCFEKQERKICAFYGNRALGSDPIVFVITPSELFQLREALAMHATFYEYE